MDATIDQARQLGRGTAEQLVRTAHGLSQAEDVNAETSALLAADDWIPDYPLASDNQADAAADQDGDQ